MPRRINNMARVSVAVLAAGSLGVGTIRAGEYHSVAQNTCSDCHTQHASVRGQTWSPTQHLLKSSTGEVALCMSCHDGTDQRAPDIVASGNVASPSDIVATHYTSKYGSSAGFFQSDYLSAESPYGHSLAPAVSVSAPLSNSYRKDGGLTCSDCHDPHGSGNYRNLLPDPNPNHPGSYDITLGVQVKEATPVDSEAPNPSVAYDTDNVAFSAKSNIDGWCTDCHDQIATNATGSLPAHFRGHPSGVAIGGSGSHTDADNWSSPNGRGDTGFGSEIGDATAGIPRLRYGSPSLSNTLAGNGDTVTCLTCHKAHGSKYKYGMTWPLHEAGADMFSGCQQCHYK